MRHLRKVIGLSIFTAATFLWAGELATEKRGELMDLIRQDCGSCHGLTLKGGLGPELGPEKMARYGADNLRHIIANGVKHTAMPAWRNQLAENEIAWIAQQLVKGVPAPEFRSEQSSELRSVGRGTGDMGVVIERASGSVKVVETTGNSILGEIAGLGDLSHASLVYSRDARYAYVFGRDGGLTKIDILGMRIVRRVIQAGNSIGGAISQNGRYVAVSNYKPGGVRVFDAETLDMVADVPAVSEDGRESKVVGLVETTGNRFVYSLFDTGEIRVLEFRGPDDWSVQTFTGIGKQPYDGIVTPNGRFYLAGLFGEDGMAVLDLWRLDQGVTRMMESHGRGKREMPVYKMPHLEGWAMTGRKTFLPGVGRSEVMVVDEGEWRISDHIPVHGQPVFVVGRPDGRQVWVNFAYPNNDTIQVIDIPTQTVIRTFKPGKGVMHMEFTPKGDQLWMSVRDMDRVDIYDTHLLQKIAELPATRPSGIFFTHRAGQLGK